MPPLFAIWIGAGPEGAPTATAEQILPLCWDMHTDRDQAEAIFTA